MPDTNTAQSTPSPTSTPNSTQSPTTPPAASTTPSNAKEASAPPPSSKDAAQGNVEPAIATPDSSPTPPKDPKEEKAAQRFAQLAKEKARIDKQAAQIKAERAELAAVKEQADQFKKEMAAFNANPYRYLKKHGLSDDQIVKEMLANGDAPKVLTGVEKELADLKAETAEIKAWRAKQLANEKEIQEKGNKEAFKKTQEDFSSKTVAPYIRENADQFLHTVAMFGEDAASKITQLMIDEANDNGGKLPHFTAKAKELETYLKSIADKIAPKSDPDSTKKKELAPEISKQPESVATQTLNDAPPNSGTIIRPADRKKSPWTQRREDNARHAAKLALLNKR